tara:strand:- start:212 stop:991 length:780 start_codon:yes stop_codon:yes gene_type:complete
MINEDLRLKIIDMIVRSKEGHIPSSFSIVDIIEYLYKNILKFSYRNPNFSKRDYFILSKGHGAAALYVVLNKHKILKEKHLQLYGNKKGILGGHPDMTLVPGIEASTGSLGHGFPTAVGLALGLRILKKTNKVYVLLGDGECHEGTVWEAANIANNLNLGNLCAIVDWNGSAKQLMPKEDLSKRWKSFGWETFLVDGHSNKSMSKVFKKLRFKLNGRPKFVLAKTIKGKGVSFLQGHGKWHHKIPNENEIDLIRKELQK